jgi:hypothetical protein
MKSQEISIIVRIVILLFLIVKELILLFSMQRGDVVMAGTALIMIIMDIIVWKMCALLIKN